jgi:succinoglycan biosynthesis transport protein ExoP
MKYNKTMKATDLLRLFRKHVILLLLIPALLGAAVAFLTKNIYSSKTTLYTGMTTGTNVQLDQSFNVFTSNAAFDNMITVIQSRETSQEVAIRLLAQHLMLSHHDPRYISMQSFLDLKRTTPAYINKLVVRHIYQRYKTKGGIQNADTTKTSGGFSFTENNPDNSVNLQPGYIDPAAYEKTVKNLYDYMVSDDTNYIYRLLNFNNPHYSIKAVSSVSVQRISSSDLIELKYNSDDPGICQQTLVLLTEVCMKNYKKIKESRSDAVVKYFEYKLKVGAAKLAEAEDRLLKFNEANKIVNFADQSRAAGNAAGNLEAMLQSKRIKLAGDNAAIQKLEEKMNAQQDLQQKSASLIEKRNKLAEINTRLATVGTGDANSQDNQEVINLKTQAESLKKDISELVDGMYNSKTSVGDASQNNLMENYLTSVKDYQETKSEISNLESKIQNAQKEYDNYAPAGVILKRIERDIAIAEQEYLELLKGLNLAKLKVQDVELSSNIKAVDPPYYPLAPNPTKRLLLVVVAAILGFLIVSSVILVMEYFDATLKNPDKAAKILGLEPAGVYPRITEKSDTINLPFITSRLMEMIIQQVELYPKGRLISHEPRTILFFSTQNEEGKTTILSNLARKLKKQGKKVIVVNFSGESLLQSELSGMDSQDVNEPVLEPQLINGHRPATSLKPANGHSGHSADQVGLTLSKPENQLNTEEHVIYHVDESYYSISNAADLLIGNGYNPTFSPDYILVELPPILYFPYPAGLVSSSDLSIMVCRSNRSWSEADQGALNTFMKRSRHNPLFLLNGVDMQVVKSTIGEVSGKQIWGRRSMKKKARI